MPIHRHVRKGVLGTVVLGVLLLTTACAGVQVQEEALMREAALPREQADGNVAIVGIDFDPPLHYMDALREQGVILLVAVENRASRPVEGIHITARLMASGPGTRTLVLEQEGILPTLEPKTITVYRFPRLRNIPIRRSYTLDVWLTPTTGHSTAPLAERHYDIRVLDR